MRIDMISETIELTATRMISDGTARCELDHRIAKGKIAFIDPSDVILCRKHMITQIADLIDSE